MTPAICLRLVLRVELGLQGVSMSGFWVEKRLGSLVERPRQRLGLSDYPYDFEAYLRNLILYQGSRIIRLVNII